MLSVARVRRRGVRLCWVVCCWILGLDLVWRADLVGNLVEGLLELEGLSDGVVEVKNETAQGAARMCRIGNSG